MDDRLKGEYNDGIPGLNIYFVIIIRSEGAVYESDKEGYRYIHRPTTEGR